MLSNGGIMAPYPVFFAVSRPDKLEREALAWRILMLIVFSIAGISMGAVFALLYLALPVVSAMALSRRGPARFLVEDAPRLTRALRWVMGAYAYLMLLTDRLPSENDDVRFTIDPDAWPVAGRGPTVTAALLRVIYSLPYALVLGILAMVSWFVWLVAALSILITENYPESLYGFQCGVLRWQARLLAYHTSLVDPYPPFSFDTGTFTSSGAERFAH
jgi:hypothetical protein